VSDAAKQALEELWSFIVFHPEFPKRICLTHREWVGLSETERHALRRQSLETNEKARPVCGHIENLVRILGKARYQPAVVTLIQLWRNCALIRVRDAAGHALYEMGTLEAWTALKSMLDDSDYLSRYFAIKATFAIDVA